MKHIDIHALKWHRDEGVAATLPHNAQLLLADVWRIHHDNYAPEHLLVATPTSDIEIVNAITALTALLCRDAQAELDQLNSLNL